MSVDSFPPSESESDDSHDDAPDDAAQADAAHRAHSIAVAAGLDSAMASKIAAGTKIRVRGLWSAAGVPPAG